MTTRREKVANRRLLGILCSAVVAFTAGCTNETDEVEKVIHDVAEALSYDEPVQSLGALQRATKASSRFAKDVTFFGRGANDTKAKRSGNALVKTGALAAYKYFKKIDVDINSCVTSVRGGAAQTECGIRVTAQDAESGEYFRESNRIKLQLANREKQWKITAAENLDPLSFELGENVGTGE